MHRSLTVAYETLVSRRKNNVYIDKRRNILNTWRDYVKREKNAVNVIGAIARRTLRIEVFQRIRMVAREKFLDRDDPAAVASADQTIAKREKGLARADARVKAYTPPAAEPADLEKQQRDLTAKYPNIDELVRRAELNRDPNYEYADGQAYYTARDAEQNYQKLKQIQRVIQGLNESLNRSHLP